MLIPKGGLDLEGRVVVGSLEQVICDLGVNLLTGECVLGFMQVVNSGDPEWTAYFGACVSLWLRFLDMGFVQYCAHGVAHVNFVWTRD